MSGLRPYLIGIKFIVITDCRAIVHLNTQKTVQPQVARWATLLSEFDLELRHHAGIKMGHVDALSRVPTDPSEDTEAEVLDERLEVLLTMSDEDQVMAIQRTDTRLKSIMLILSQEESGRTQTDIELVKDYFMENGLLYKEVIVGVKRKL